MALKFFIFSAVCLALAHAGLLTPVTYVQKTATYPQVDSVASTHESVVRSFDGTVSHHSKAVDTPFSSVRKTDTRINNNVYTPALAKTVTYAAPLTNTVYSHAPSVEHVQYEKYPTSADLYTHDAPTITKTLSYPAPAPSAHVYHHESPATATTTYHHGPIAATYTHNDPAVSAYGTSQTVHYSPANMVSHMSFDGFGTHWGF